MAKFKVDTAETGVLVAAMETLNNNFDPTVPILEACSSCGGAIEEMQLLYKNVETTKKGLKDLMEKTIAYLKSVQLTYDEADRTEAELLLKEMGI